MVQAFLNPKWIKRLVEQYPKIFVKNYDSSIFQFFINPLFFILYSLIFYLNIDISYD